MNNPKLASKETSDALMLTGAMNKMAEEMDFGCDAYEFSPVCDELSVMCSMRNVMKQKTKTKG